MPTLENGRLAALCLNISQRIYAIISIYYNFNAGSTSNNVF